MTYPRSVNLMRAREKQFLINSIQFSVGRGFEWVRLVSQMKSFPKSVEQSQRCRSGRSRGWILSALLVALLAGAARSQTPDAFNPGPNDVVFATITQPDGQIIVGGYFGMIGGQRRDHLARLKPDGTLDPYFNPAATSHVLAMAVQRDGKILVGGNFGMLGGLPRAYLGRLNPDGSVDLTFNPGADRYVNCLALQPDGKILVGGFFSKLAGQPRADIGRLNPDGSLDTSFNPGADNDVYSLALQTNGQILVGGSFGTLGGQPRSAIGRLNGDGSLDLNFDPGASGFVNCLAVQADNRILVGGWLTTLAGETRNRLGRLNPDGTLDGSFDPGADGPVYSLALQANGRILVGGAFANLAGQPCNRLGRLDPDGTLNADFLPDANGTVFALSVQPDGKILAGGEFSMLGGQSRSCFGRLTNNDIATESLTFDGANFTWLRTGVCPEIWRTSFESSTNGEVWTDLGAASRLTNGWQLNGISVPSNSTVRVRGYVAAAYEGSSGGFVEQDFGPFVVTESPRSRTNLAATAATLYCQAAGLSPLAFQWLKDGAPLDDGANISGAHTPFLGLSNVFGADAGAYSVVITNTFGATTSAVAMVTVTDPWITNQPVGRIANAGQAATPSVVAIGSSLSYQWQKDGAIVVDGTGSSLVFTNLQGTNAGYYSVVVSNSFSSVTSAVVLLTVNAATADAFNPTVDGEVYALALQTDGKILIGGSFFNVAGVSRASLARVKSDGTLDLTFSSAATANASVFSIGVQPDGKILVAGWFSTLAGQTRRGLGRLNASGSLDTGFNPNAIGGVSFPGVYSAVLQPDGKIIMGGDFRSLGGLSRTNLGRLNSDGTLDTNFTARANDIVYALALQADGNILVGGAFTNLCGEAALRLGRLSANGTLDPNFHSGADDIPLALAVQPDGKIVVGGPFTNLSGQARSRIGRLNQDGSVDPDFNPGANGIVGSLALQADGRILVGGQFSTLGGQSRTNLGRLRPDGMLDATFNPGANGVVYALAAQKDGKTLAGGSFTSLAGQIRSRLGRLTNTEPATDELTFDGASITWTRGGAGPELGRTSFDASTNGISWVNLGSGERIAGGWQLTGLSLQMGASIRARGYATGGRYSGSTWFLESTLNVATNSLPLILEDNGHFGFATNRFGFDVAGLLLRGVIVDGSTNLTAWSPLWTNLLGNGPVYFSDPSSANLPRRFYRARLQ